MRGRKKKKKKKRKKKKKGFTRSFVNFCGLFFVLVFGRWICLLLLRMIDQSERKSGDVSDNDGWCCNSQAGVGLAGGVGVG